MDNAYTQYYLSQAGGGFQDIGPLYHAIHRYQIGRGGIGAFFSGIYRYLRPLFKSGLGAIRKQAVKTGVNVLNELGKRPLKDILTEQGKVAVEELTQKGVKKLKKLQDGDGVGDSTLFLKPNIKRRLPILRNQFSSIIKKRLSTSRKQKKNNKKIKKDIFN